jgi:hypothetical protein
MNVSSELQELVVHLTPSEKRMARLMGIARAGEGGSQQLELWDWMRSHPAEEEVPEHLAKNLPMVTVRLKAHILDTLRILHKDADVDAQLRTGQDELALLLERKLHGAARRLLNRMLQLAQDFCRHEHVLQLLQMKLQWLKATIPSGLEVHLVEWRAEERAAEERLRELNELRFAHEWMHAKAKQLLAPRDEAQLAEFRELGGHERIERLRLNGGPLEQALATSIQAMMHLLCKAPMSAVMSCHDLLQSWKHKPHWQADQPQLLLLICRTYQNACYLTIKDPEVMALHLSLIPSFDHLRSEVAVGYRRLLFHNQLTLSLNTGNFEVVSRLIPEIDGWLTAHHDQMTEVQRIHFLHNFAIAEFLAGNFANANRWVHRITQLSDRKVRKDIQDFARVLQAILQLELGDAQLSDYLARSGKRHFGKSSRAVHFEPLVFDYIGKAAGLGDAKERNVKTEEFIARLESLSAGQKDGVPVLGLMEVKLWAQARLLGLPLRQVFLETVKENLSS